MRTIQPQGTRFAVIYRHAVEDTFNTRAEAEAYIRKGVFPSVFDRRGPSPFLRRGPSPFRRRP